VKIFDAVGGPGFARLIASAAIDGIVLVYGALSKEVNPLPAIHTLRRRLTIRGFAVREAYFQLATAVRRKF
jgi:NADPH:quinone reductase-like Zn-dependent oxidoreductase